MAGKDDIAQRTADRMDQSGGDAGAGGEGDKGGSYDTVKQDALDEMTSILGLGGKDAERFGRALSDWMKACMDAEDSEDSGDSGDSGDGEASGSGE